MDTKKSSGTSMLFLGKDTRLVFNCAKGKRKHAGA